MTRTASRKSVPPKPRGLRAAVAGWLGATLLGMAAAGATDQEIPLLRPDVAIAHPLTAGELHAYLLDLVPGVPWCVTLEQRDINAVVTLVDPEGKHRFTVDSPLGQMGTETLVVTAETAGSYRVEIRPAPGAAAAGGYEVMARELSRSTPQERQRLRARTALSEAGRLFFAGGKEKWREAMDRYREAAGAWRALGDRFEEAAALHALAELSRQSGELREALAGFDQVRALWQSLGEERRQARTWNGIGLAHWQLSELSEARSALEKARVSYQSLGDRHGEAEVTNNLGMVAHSRGRQQTALESYRRALELYRELGNSKYQATVLNNIGYAYHTLGEPQQAIDHYQQALSLRQTLGEKREQAQTLNNIAVVFRNLGEMQEALAYYDRARELYRASGHRRLEATALNNIGVAYQSLGEMERAAEYFRNSLRLRRELDDLRGQMVTFNNLGRLYHDRGTAGLAAAFYRRALRLSREIPDRRIEGITLMYLGEAHESSGELTLARELLDQAVAVLREVEDRLNEARAVGRRGMVRLSQGEAQRARSDLRTAFDRHRELGNRLDEVEVRVALARAERQLGNRDPARAHLEEAIAIIESLRTRVASPDRRASFLGARQDAYRLLIDLLMARHRAEPAAGWDRRALEVSERARARSLLDLLHESGTELRRGINPALAERRRSLERRLNAKATRELTLRSREKREELEATVRELESEIQAILAELDNVDAEIHRRHPRHAALVQPRPIGVEEIQNLLDAETILLEYALGDERSFLWAVDQSSVESFELPGREELERAARAVYEELSTIDYGRRRQGSEATTALARWLLGPVRDRLGEKRLAVVADGALHYIPFAALPVPESGPAGEPVPLVVDHEVVHLPSAAVLAVQRRELAARPPAPRRAAILADPVFSARDRRLPANSPSTAPTAAQRGGPETVMRSAREVGLGGFDRLVWSGEEASAIAALAPAGEVLVARDFAASRATAFSPRLREYRVVHFATHGLINAHHPELSGLVLSLVDETGAPQEGFLRLRDVYQLELAADLVVLSGCRTALGHQVRGEGLLGLTRGFMYAGAPRVVASLWWVQDRATAELMERFYRAMWNADLRPAAALRQAQLALLRGRDFRRPFHWAAFVHQGDWR